MASIDLYKLFNVERQEKVSVLLLSLQSVFVGIFYGAFDISAHALFLEVYPASMIPNAYVISGIVGIVITFLYSKLQTKLKFKHLAPLNLFFIALVTAILWQGFHFTTSNYLIFAVFVMMGPLNIIGLLGFWGTTGRLFTLRQGKRLFGLVDSGYIFGIIISTYAIPVLLDLGLATKNLLLIAALSVSVALVIQFFISGKYELDKRKTVQGEEEETSQLPLKDFIKQPYERLMGIFVILSMITAFFIQYSFLSVTKENYPDPTDLAKFLGYFTGSLTLFTFLFKTFVYSKLMKTYGLKTSLLISPVLLGLLTIIAVLVGSFYGYTAASASFAFFFLLISLSRLFSKALKDSVEAPSFKILYQSLPENYRHDVQAKVDGTINEMAALSSGLLLAGFSLLPFIKLIHFSYSLIIIIGIWVFAAFWLYRRYKASLEKSLLVKKEDADHGRGQFNLNEYVNEALNSSDFSNIQNILSFYSDIQPVKYQQLVQDLTGNQNEKLREYSYLTIGKNVIYDAYEALKEQFEKEKSAQLKTLAGEAIEKLKPTAQKEIDETSIQEYAKSSKIEKRIKAIRLIADNYEEKFNPLLKQLLRDQNSKVKIEAIKTVPRFENSELLDIVIDYLNVIPFFTYAFDALVESGEIVLDDLEQAFYKSETDEKVKLRIISIFDAVGGKKALSYLENKLDHYNIDIFRKVLNALVNNDYQVPQKDEYKIQQLIEKHIGIAAWNLAAKQSIQENPVNDEITQAIEEEITENYEVIYQLLIIAYKPESVHNFRNNLESGTSEGISYALELLELFIAEEIKPKLLPLFDDISLNERVKQLQLHYPVNKMEPEELLTNILNRDMNYINVWTKACALYSFNDLEEYEITDDIVAQLFNPIPILRETAAYIVYLKDPDKLFIISERLDSQVQHSLIKKFTESSEVFEELLISRILKLRKLPVFSEIPGYYVTKFMNITEIWDKKQTEENFHYQANFSESLLIVVNGEMGLMKEDKNPEIYKSGDIIEITDDEGKNLNFSVSSLTEGFNLIKIPKPSFYFQMFDFPVIIKNYIQLFNSLNIL